MCARDERVGRCDLVFPVLLPHLISSLACCKISRSTYLCIPPIFIEGSNSMTLWHCCGSERCQWLLLRSCRSSQCSIRLIKAVACSFTHCPFLPSRRLRKCDFAHSFRYFLPHHTYARLHFSLLRLLPTP